MTLTGGTPAIVHGSGSDDAHSDTIANVENLVGGTGADTVTGDSNNNTYFATVDNVIDVFDGGGGTDTVNYSAYTAALTVTLNGSTFVIGPRLGPDDLHSDTIANVENFVGGTGVDTVTGDGRNNTYFATVDNVRDVFDGGGGTDTANYSAYTTALTVTLNGSTPVIVQGSGRTMPAPIPIANVENVVGGSGNDIFVGDANNNVFTGGGGNDTITGGAGLDRAVYTDATGPITVDMVGRHGERGRDRQRYAGVGRIDPRQRLCDTYVATGYAGASAIGSMPATYNEFEGMAGNDVITGNGSTFLSYLNATGPVTVDIAAGIATGDASVGTDTFTGVQGVRGSAFADTLLGSDNASAPEVFEGRGGNDFIDGRGGFDRATYWFRTDNNVTGGITVNLAAGTVVGDASVGTDTLRSIESVRGTNFDDSYVATGFGRTSAINIGSPGTFNEFEGLGGNDSITGNGNTRISYVNATDGVTVDLNSPTVGVPGSTGIAFGTVAGDVAGIGTDTIFGGVNSIIGSSFADTLSGSDNAAGTAETFDGGAGNDTINGRGGFDQAVYNADLGTVSGIQVDMAAGTVTGDASIGTDTLRSIESVRGTNFDDTYDAHLFGQAGALNIGSSGTFNEFEGMGGNDTITGNGNTRISYLSAAAGVTVTFSGSGSGTAQGTASGDIANVGTDTFAGVNAVRGSNFADTFIDTGAALTEFEGMGGQ